MADFTKKVKRILHEQAMLAHEEELRRALLPLASAFDQWENGKMNNEEMVELIHNFHQGPSRELFQKYTAGVLEMNVAHAIVTGVLDKNQVPPELLDHLSKQIAFHENNENL